MWIIEDMFKSRKGFELKNSLTEYIPDTYLNMESGTSSCLSVII